MVTRFKSFSRKRLNTTLKPMFIWRKILMRSLSVKYLLTGALTQNENKKNTPTPPTTTHKDSTKNQTKRQTRTRNRPNAKSTCSYLCSFGLQFNVVFACLCG